eukprot:COSAG05_NODE_23327_length_259_cov_0.300000_1_plen_49_part_01
MHWWRAARAKRRERDSAQAESGGTTADRRASVFFKQKTAYEMESRDWSS